MNNATRKEIAEIVEELEALTSAAETIKEKIEALAEAEREKWENMPEAMQYGYKGEALEQAADNLENAAGELDLEATIDAVKEYLEEAAQ